MAIKGGKGERRVKGMKKGEGRIKGRKKREGGERKS